MREDMFKVIVERPRGGNGWATRSRKRLTKDGDLPTKIGVSRHMGVTRAKSKWLSENLAPLKRFIGKQVGRPWDKVYGEIVATLTSRDPVQQHVLQHLDGYVARHVTIDKDGCWISPDRRFWRNGPPWHQPYYVDPKNGLLRESAKLWKKLGIDPKAWRRKDETDPNVRVLDKMRELRCIGGVWYEVLFNQNNDPEAWVYDLLRRERVRATERHAVAKRQLSRAELDAFGIENSYND